MSEYQRPLIIKENARGYVQCSIQDEMFKKREIECVGVISTNAVNALISQLLYLNNQDPNAEIIMYINSPGGEVTSGLALYDVMMALECPIRTVCIGTAASMGAVIFAAGNNREVLPHSRIMIHDPLIQNGVGGSALMVKSISDDLMRTRQLIAEILAEHTNKTVDEILELTMKDTYFYADEAVSFGLADTVKTNFKKEGN